MVLRLRTWGEGLLDDEHCASIIFVVRGEYRWLGWYKAVKFSRDRTCLKFCPSCCGFCFWSNKGDALCLRFLPRSFALDLRGGRLHGVLRIIGQSLLIRSPVSSSGSNETRRRPPFSLPYVSLAFRFKIGVSFGAGSIAALECTQVAEGGKGVY